MYLTIWTLEIVSNYYVDLNFVIFFSIKQSNIKQNPIKLDLIFFLKILTKIVEFFFDSQDYNMLTHVLKITWVWFG